MHLRTFVAFYVCTFINLSKHKSDFKTFIVFINHGVNPGCKYCIFEMRLCSINIAYVPE